MRLYHRLLSSTNPIIAAILKAGRNLPEGWVTTAELQLSAAFPEGPPITPLEWQQHLQQWEIAQKQADAEELLYNSRRHPNLAHYSPYIAAQPSNPCINRMIHHHSINDANAITISRLLCGGQGLNAGDPIRPTEVCMRKACKFCLSLGQPRVETLWYFLHQCPLIAIARQSNEVKEIWGQPEKITQLHLSVWTSKQRRVIRSTMIRMWELRQTFNRDLAKTESCPEEPKPSRCAAPPPASSAATTASSNHRSGASRSMATIRVASLPSAADD